MTDLVFVVDAGGTLHVFGEELEHSANALSPIDKAVAMDSWQAEPIIDDRLDAGQPVYIWHADRGIARPVKL